MMSLTEIQARLGYSVGSGRQHHGQKHPRWNLQRKYEAQIIISNGTDKMYESNTL
jgi:hypothetical protein